MVEVGGIEPPSEYNARPSSTCVVDLAFSRFGRCRSTGHDQNQPFSLGGR
jgi:hypothetical protein